MQQFLNLTPEEILIEVNTLIREKQKNNETRTHSYKLLLKIAGDLKRVCLLKRYESKAYDTPSLF